MSKKQNDVRISLGSFKGPMPDSADSSMENMQNGNFTAWDSLKTPPEWALKKITGGRLSGKTDINPQWRYSVMTKIFGMCGFGWKFTVDRLWTEPAPAGEVFAFAQVSVYTKRGEIWNDPIPGIGGSMLVDKEKSGLHANDEAYKMAITDALGTALKMLGVAADIYCGLFDGTKYRNETPSMDKSDPFQADPPKPEKKTEDKTTNFGFLKEMGRLKEAVGDQKYYQVLGVHGIEHANEIVDRKKQVSIWEELSSKADELDKAGKLLDDQPEKEEGYV